MNKWIGWSRWTRDGMIQFGQMPVSEVQQNLHRFEQEAKRLLEMTGADHLLYGVKQYDAEGELEHVKFYLIAMDDEEFQRSVASIPDVTVYALHRRR